MVEILHTADTHLGYQQYHKTERQADFRDAFEQVIDAAIDADVDAIVHAGDLFHDSRPGIRPLETTLTELQRLKTAEIPFLMVVGNHDSTRDHEWVELFAKMDLAVRLDDSGHLIGDVKFYGLDHTSEARRENLDYQFSPNVNDYAVLVAHGLFKPFDHGNWDTSRILEDSLVEFDAILAGDNHEPKQATIGETVISYSGSTERTATDQRKPRTYSLVTIADGGVDIKRRAIDTRRFEYIHLDLMPGEGINAVRDSIRNQDVKGAVLKVTLNPADPPKGVTSEAEYEHIPVGPIQECGAEVGALATRVTDNRSIDESDQEYREIEFADINTVVRKRLEERDIDPLASDLVEMAMDIDRIAKSNVQSTAKETVLEQTELESDADVPILEQTLDGDDNEDDTTASPDTDRSDAASDDVDTPTQD